MEMRAVSEDFDVCALARRRVRKAREPVEGNHDGPAVAESDRESLAGHLNRLSSGFTNLMC